MSEIDPAAGGDGQTGDAGCLNCRALLTGPYCAACGQKALVPRSLANFSHDMVQGLFNFEGKIWRTLPMLAWRPGELTHRYIVGQRARFVSPVALYLFSVFLMFAVLNFTGTIDPGTTFTTQLDVAANAETAELTALERARQSAIARGAPVTVIDRRIAAKKLDLEQLDRTRRGELLSAKADADDETPPWLRAIILRIQSDPRAFILKVQDATSKYSWLLIPLSVPFLWLLFPFNRRFALYDHTVFVTYSLSFMMILVISGGLLVSLGAASFASMLFFIPPWHMYRQLKGAYGLSWLGALWRTVALTSFAFVAVVIFGLAMVALGVFN